jgi:alkylation response protein AidB-like acyl-CoA dehydrogenase
VRLYQPSAFLTHCQKRDWPGDAGFGKGRSVDIVDSPAEAAFRAEARSWLESVAVLRDPAIKRVIATTDGEMAAHTSACRSWQQTLHAGGWAGITWPTAFGGRGLGSMEASIFDEEQARFNVSTGSFAVSIGMVGPTLIAHGTDDQRKHLDAMLRGEEVWCQLFSEPGAGSDLASLGTRAERDGDEWLINGQKVWTSMAQHAEYAILLARTNPDAPKHGGITYFIVDMTAPGIEVRPLRQMTGLAHFNEVFLTDVRLPAHAVVGEANGGWKVAQTTLSNERAFISGGSSWGPNELIGLARQQGRLHDPVVRQELMKVYSRAEVLRYIGYQMRTATSQKKFPGVVALTLKRFYSKHWAAAADVAMAISGAHGMLAGESAVDAGAWQQHLQSQFAVRLGGGTDEVQANVIGERGLGLPREPGVGKDTPWRDLKKA